MLGTDGSEHETPGARNVLPQCSCGLPKLPGQGQMSLVYQPFQGFNDILFATDIIPRDPVDQMNRNVPEWLMN